LSAITSLIYSLKNYKKYTFLGVLFHFITALFTVVSIPLLIPFFQILFGSSPSDYKAAVNIWDLEAQLNYGFSRLIAISDRQHALVVVCIITCLIFFLRNLSRFLSSYFIVPARNGLLRDLRLQLFDSFLELPYRDRSDVKKGQLLSLLSNDINEVDHGLLKALELFFRVPLIVLGSLIFMLWINMELTLLALVLVLFTFFVIGKLSHMLKKTSLKIQQGLGEINSIADEYLGAAKLIKSYNAESFFRSKMIQQNQENYKLSNQILRRRDLASPLSEFLAVTIVAFLLWYGAQLVFRNEIEPTTFFAFIFAFYNIVDPAKNFSREYYNVQKGVAALDRINEFINQVKANPQIDNGSKPVKDFIKNITFLNVSFSYHDGDAPILKQINVVINKGDKIGIVGLSGAGKSTLLDILMRFHQHDSGEIILDDTEIEQYKLVDYRQLFGLVTQDSELFHMTIAENITFSNNDIDQILIDSAKLDFIEGRGKLNEVLAGDDGLKLSGGERQRISLARALYHNPEIILLDEPTNSLDNKSEQDVVNSILNLFADKTILLVSHNTKLLEKMDRILVINDGTIVQEGTYDHLSNQPGLFSELNNITLERNS
jgi:ABC-type multidrug transport system fused ATPase/permease subunit